MTSAAYSTAIIAGAVVIVLGLLLLETLVTWRAAR